MKVTSNLHYDEYRTAMKEQMGRFFAFGMERFTGIVLGPFFYITYHSGHEFNRRITNEKNRAIGFMRRTEGGTDVSALRFAGYADPISFVMLYLLFLLLSVFILFLRNLEFSAEWHLYALIFAAVYSIASAAKDSLTQRGREGARVVEAFLQDPSDYYQYVD